ncbi:MAG: SUMF1/EgtB/PvdO family nonheme iron enzyme [Planctomycetota bacterium]|nr:SUMF1/EgtB/PvdO family nonheme iron enzyme [Planctomycetota bacterium]
MAYALPLEPFFAWLQAERGWAVDVQDRRRVSRALQADEQWTVERLGQVLAGVLAHDPEQWADFHRHFAAFFAAESYAELRPHPLDRAALIAALSQVEIEQPDPEADRRRQLADTVALQQELEVTVLRPSQTAPATAFRLREVPWPLQRPAADGRRPALDWDRDGPRQFFLADVGPPPEPPLSSTLLDLMADGMGYFRSSRPSRELHVEDTIRASVRAGYPVPHFLPGREICRLLILEDTWAEARAWNTAPRELADGLAARGIPVTHGLFDGLPVRFRLADGSAECDLEDWEDERGGLLVLLFTEGKGFYRRRAARVLEDLASWPRLAWIEFRERRFWDACTRLAIEQGLAVFPATAEGLWEMSRALLTEQGRTRQPLALPSPLGGDLPLAQRVERALDDALPWAELCAVLPSAPQRLADALRRRFHPQLPPTHFGRLCTWPGTERDAEGLHFSEPVRQILCRGFYARRSPAEREALLGFVREQIATSGRLLPADSLARYACEGIQVRLSLVAGSVPQSRSAGRLVTSGAPVAELLRLDLKQDTALLAEIGRLSDEQSRLLEQWKIVRRPPSPYPADLVRIPAGTFLMGDPTEEGDGDERPQHAVEVSTFYIAKHPVTWQLWQEIHGWAVEQGYQFDKPGAGRGPQHPVTDISWYDAVKWCNARSEKEGRRPAYYTDASRTEPYHQGQLDLPAEAVDWTANGYRLPTEAEWEKAARGGLEGQHYPWESQGKGYERLISPEKANYGKDGTTPVGSYPPNGFGLFDMAGNVYDWVWDRWDTAWYRNADATTSDTRGPTGGVNRVFRGGCWACGAGGLRCAYRFGWLPSLAYDDQGFRLAGGQGQAVAELDEGGERGRRDDDRSEPPEESGADQACLMVELVPSKPEASARHPASKPEASARTKSRMDFQSVQDGLEIHPTRSPDGLENHPTSGSAETIELRCGEAPGEVVQDSKPVVLDSGECRVTARRRFCWPATTAYELEPGKAYHLQILMQRQPPPGMVEIAAGPFVMGDPTTEGYDDERPKHEVFVGAFFIAQYQVTWVLWREVYDWAVRRNYEFENPGGGDGDDHPVHSVNWHDAVKWCNAYSEREGRQPAYFEDRSGGKVYRQGNADILAAAVDWNGEGFRLPTEAEWENAARGGLVGHHYPWASEGKGHERFIGPDKAQYSVSQGNIAPVGSFPANGYGLYDMAGNVWEWCWDWWDKRWYDNPEATQRNTLGPTGGVDRVCRGGGWASVAWFLRCAYRRGGLPSNAGDFRGFRLAGGQVQAAP